ncbi:MAG: hypothetical protein EZS28_006036 [Streblomastix strix]|uniref:non-specific serine/threonine protein kinase n=1 Tax=Streblomastix strix TaxID=222440 RepID=A0A5J4WW41_9EUKA|nr:MAG: hypothetical protein EZS28_006036 [Streblomastix strix]
MQTLKKLGEGGFGSVVLAFSEELGIVAAKLIKDDKFDVKEFDVGKQLALVEQNPFTLKYLLKDSNFGYSMIVMEYSNMGSLDSLTQAEKEVPITLIRPIMKQFLQGLVVLHENNIIHRDIKGANILLHSPEGSGRVHVLIADLGIIKVVKNIDEEIKMTRIGTRPYEAPELRIGNARSDGRHPFQVQGCSSVDDFLRKKKLIRPQSFKNDILWNLISNMLQFDKNKRLTSIQALNHEFFVGDQAINETTKLAQQLASKALIEKRKRKDKLVDYDIDALYTVPLTEYEDFTKQKLQDSIDEINKLKRNIVQVPGSQIPSVGGSKSQSPTPGSEPRISIGSSIGSDSEPSSIEQSTPNLTIIDTNSQSKLKVGPISRMKENSSYPITQPENSSPFNSQIQKSTLTPPVYQVTNRITRKTSTSPQITQPPIKRTPSPIIQHSRSPPFNQGRQVPRLSTSPEASTNQVISLQQLLRIKQVPDVLDKFILIIIDGLNKAQITSSFIISSPESPLQQLLKPIPHPQLAEFERQGVIKHIIESVIMVEYIDEQNKQKAWEVLDYLYPEGIQLPPSLKAKVIAYYNSRAKGDDKYKSIKALIYLSQLALCQENYPEISSNDVVETALGYINGGTVEQRSIDYDKVKYVLQLLIHLFLFSSKQVQTKIQTSVTKQILNKLRSGAEFQQYIDEIKQLLSSFSDPQTMKEAVKIGRFAENMTKEGHNDLIRAGLPNKLNELAQKGIQVDDGEGIMHIIGEIVKSLVKDNQEAGQIFVNDSNFVEEQIRLLTTAPLTRIKERFLSSLYYLSQNCAPLQQKRMYDKGIVQSMMKIVVSQDQDVQWRSIWIIYYIIKAGTDGVKQGAQHPYKQQLTADKTIDKLIQMFNDDDIESIHLQIALILAILFKATKLPSEISLKVIQSLKGYMKTYFFELAVLAECPDNHTDILIDDFEKYLTVKVFQTEDYLDFVLNMLKYGNQWNQYLIASAVKEKVEKIANVDYVNEITQKYGWEQKRSDQLKEKANLARTMIQKVQGEKK